MLARLLMGAFGLLGAGHAVLRLFAGDGAALADVPGIAIGILVCLPLIAYAALGEGPFVRRFPTLATLFGPSGTRDDTPGTPGEDEATGAP